MFRRLRDSIYRDGPLVLMVFLCVFGGLLLKEYFLKGKVMNGSSVRKTKAEDLSGFFSKEEIEALKKEYKSSKSK